MKKIITLLFTFGAFTASFAQSPSIDKAKKVITKEPGTTTSYPNDRRGNETSTRYPTSSTSREAEINDINKYYDSKIRSVRANPLLSADEKEKRIRDLEYERAQKIREINNRYYGNNSGTTNGKKYGKTNNPGKHLGWEKGKGNPHRSDGSNAKGKNKNK